MRSPAVFVAFVCVLILAGVLCIGFAVLAGSSGRTRRTRTKPPWLRAFVGRARERRRRARQATVPWVYYSRPDVESGLWEVGVERVLDFEVLDQQCIAYLSLDSPDILDAEGEAIARARRYNDARGVQT